MNREIVELREVIQKLVPLLAGKGLVVTQRGSQAYVTTNTRTRKPEVVNIPNISDNATSEFIEAIQGFIDHEVGHVLHTDWDYYGRAPSGKELAKISVQQFLNTHNIVEDVMIEREMGKTFPGSKRNISRTRKYFLAKITEPAVKKARDDKEAFIYLLVPTMRALGGHEEMQEWMDAGGYWKNPFVKGVVDGLKPETIELLKTCSTTKETLAIAEELHLILYPPAPPKPATPPAPSPPPAPEPEEDEDEPAASTPDPKDDDEEDAAPKAPEPYDDGSEADDEEPPVKTTDKDEDPAGEGATEEPDDDCEGSGDEEDESRDKEDGDEGEGDEPDAEDDEDEGMPASSGAGSAPEPEDEDEGDGEDDDGADAEDEGDDSDDFFDEGRNPFRTEGADGGGVGEIGTDEPDEDTGERDGAGGVGNAEAKSIFDFDDDAFEEADMSSQLGILISEEAVEAMDPRQYLVFTREMDRIEPVPVPEDINDKWVPRMEEEVRQMTAKMRKDIERIMASQSHVIRTPGHRRGKLHSPSLFRVAQGDPRVFSVKEEHVSKDTAVTLLADNSGSMSGEKMRLAMIASYALCATLNAVKIPHEVLGFTTGNYYDVPVALREAMAADIEKSHISYDRIEPLAIPIYKSFDERLDAEVKRRFAYMMNAQRGLSGNIDGESLEVAAERLMKRSEKRKVMIVLSDGQPAGSHKSGPHLSYVTRNLEKNGIECIGIGIMDSSVKRFYKKWVVLNDAKALPNEVMGEIKKLLA